MLPNTSANEKANAISQWIRSVLNRIEHYKAEHNMLLNESMTLFDLALRTIALPEGGRMQLEINERNEHLDVAVGYERPDEASVVIRNVLSFLKLEE